MRTVRKIVADNIFEYCKDREIYGYQDRTDTAEYVVLRVYDGEIEIEIENCNKEHYITVQKVVVPVEVSNVKARKTEKYEWVTTNKSKDITKDIINVISELL